MIAEHFWPSLMGKCIREQVRRKTHPEEFLIPKDKLVFLKMGDHYCYEFLKPLGIPMEVNGRLEKEYGPLGKEKKITVSGRADGIFNSNLPTSLVVEVKAITEKKYKMISKPQINWRDVYPEYYDQIQIYLAMKEFPSRGVIIFINRSTAEVMGGLCEDIPNYTFGEEFIVESDLNRQRELFEKAFIVSDILRGEGEVPERCDLDRYCFFCQERRFGRAKPKTTFEFSQEDFEGEFINPNEFFSFIEKLYKTHPKKTKFLFDFPDRQVEINRSRGKHCAQW